MDGAPGVARSAAASERRGRAGRHVARSLRLALRARSVDKRALSAAVLCVAACSVDGRELVTGFATTKGAGGEAGAPNAVEDLNAGLLAGAGGAPDCERSDCWSFDDGVEGWEPEDGIAQRWTSADVDRDGRSGSLVVTNFDTRPSKDFWMGGTWKCVPVRENRDYRVTLSLFIPRNQAAGAAGFGLEYFNAPDCAGLLLDLTSFLTANAGSWQFVRRPLATPEGAKSALIRLLATKVHEDPSFEARFDDVSLDAP